MHRWFMAVLLLLGPAAVLAADTATTGKVELGVASYQELGALVQQNRGKVILVDFWADY